MDIKNTIFVNQAFASAQRKAEAYRHEFIMPEHLLSAIIEQDPFIHTLQDTFYNYVELSISLENYLTEEVETIPDNVEYELGLSVQLSSLLQHAYMVTEYSSAEELGVLHLIQDLLQLEDSLGMPFPEGSSRRRPARIPQSAHYPLRRSGAGRRSRRCTIPR